MRREIIFLLRFLYILVNTRGVLRRKTPQAEVKVKAEHYIIVGVGFHAHPIKPLVYLTNRAGTETCPYNKSIFMQRRHYLMMKIKYIKRMYLKVLQQLLRHGNEKFVKNLACLNAVSLPSLEFFIGRHRRVVNT